jgi:two-component system, LytTR family, response regulator
MLKVILLDDEPFNLDNLSFILKNDCKAIDVVLQTTVPMEVVQYANEHSFDILFLDIQMPELNGFDVLEKIQKRAFHVVFVTTYDSYMLRAIKAGAFDYLQKPVEIVELQKTIIRLQEFHEQNSLRKQGEEQLTEYFNHNHKHTYPHRIALPQLKGLSFLEVENITALEASNNYTVVYENNKTKRVVTKMLKEFEEILNPNQFYRIHKSFIINLHSIQELTTEEGLIVKMVDGNAYPVSRRQHDSFLEKVKEISLNFKRN